MNREKKKQQTRAALMDAALQLVGRGDNFSCISLREVAKTAGLVPTSFYRHFQSMDELGHCLVDELGVKLRQLMRMARKQDAYIETMTRQSLIKYADYVAANKPYFYFMCQARTGASLPLREALRSELRFFSNELAADIKRLKIQQHLSSSDLDLFCHLIVTTVADATIDLQDLQLPPAESKRIFVEQMTKKLRLLWLGMAAWRSTPDA